MEGERGRIAGHDVHFLSRLHRVDERQAELALRLYHRPALVRAIVGNDARAPPYCSKSCRRVAIPLDAGPDPPYAIVATCGRFVTCLGAGMGHGCRRAIPWSRVERHVWCDPWPLTFRLPLLDWMRRHLGLAPPAALAG